MGKGVSYAICPFAGCHQNCVLTVSVRDGRICKVESTEFPQDPGARCICLRGLASSRMVYHPGRLKHPLRRAGARGEGRWEKISWEEAFDAISDKLLEVKEKYGPQSVKINSYGSSNVGLLAQLSGERFANSWGAGGVFEKGWLSDGGTPAASLLTLGHSGQGHDPQDYLNSKMLIIWGGNLAETEFREMKFILDARDKGAKIVVVGPVYDAMAAKADLWVPLRLGTDAALALGMINIIIEKGLYDREYVVRNTVGPFLVREDERRFLREEDIETGTSDEYVIWDKNRSAFCTLDYPSKAPALLGEFNIKGIRCKTAFQLLAERATQYTPKRVAEVTGVPESITLQLAEEYAQSKPSAIRTRFGLVRTYHGNLGARAVIILAALTGNVGRPGGGASVMDTGFSISLNHRAVAFPSGAPGTKRLPGAKNAFRGWTAVRDGKPYPIKVLFITYQNPLQNYGNARSYLRIFSDIELIVVSEIFMSLTAQHADIVLPEATIFERSDIGICRHHLVKINRVIEPLHESKPPFEIWSELAKRVGLGKYFTTPEDLISGLLDSKDPSLHGITLKRLEKESIIRCNVPTTPYIPFEDKIFPTTSGRIEFYVEDLAGHGEELPLHKEPRESPRESPLAECYPLSFMTVKRRTRTQSICADMDWMLEIEKEPHLDINSKDANSRGINNGDVVEVFNDRGRARLKARINENFPPGTVNIDHGWRPDQFIMGHYSDLLHGVDTSDIVNPALEIDSIIPDPRASAHLIYYDCLVEVKRV